MIQRSLSLSLALALALTPQFSSWMPNSQYDFISSTTLIQSIFLQLLAYAPERDRLLSETGVWLERGPTALRGCSILISLEADKAGGVVGGSGLGFNLKGIWIYDLRDRVVFTLISYESFGFLLFSFRYSRVLTVYFEHRSVKFLFRLRSSEFSECSICVDWYWLVVQLLLRGFTLWGMNSDRSMAWKWSGKNRLVEIPESSCGITLFRAGVGEDASPNYIRTSRCLLLRAVHM